MTGIPVTRHAADHVYREMAVGNTFGATALSSYGGFWLSVGIILTPGGFQIISALEKGPGGPAIFYDSFGYFLMVNCRIRSRALSDSNLRSRAGGSLPLSS